MIRFHPPKDLHRAGRVARAFSLQDVVLAQLDARREVAYGDLAPEASSSSPTIKFSDDANGKLSEDGATLAVRVEFTVVGSRDDTLLLSVGGEFELRYSRKVGEAEIEDEDISVFARINGIYNSWPYIREAVSSTFTRLGFPAFTMDSLVISPAKEVEEI
ncbi:hypothetical protein Poly30_11120 [Planctomycetes bacterium Poly30]|uniref:Preprotein translocase subunit SecB n=1 Tax=Saltatorellus ferox TaxID=2528018 RepID=A0A518ENF9_9BACT|nr:hypothetical protein Poly30_11120 [Planctomycetes bacterium Poly30]